MSNNIRNKDTEEILTEEILKEFGSCMNAHAAQSNGLYSYNPNVCHAKEYVIRDYTSEIRRQLGKFVSPVDANGFGWSQRDDQHGKDGKDCPRYYCFVSSDGESHRLHYQFDLGTEKMILYLDDKIINNVQLDLATKTTMELELYAELWLLQHLKYESKSLESID